MWQPLGLLLSCTRLAFNLASASRAVLGLARLYIVGLCASLRVPYSAQAFLPCRESAPDGAGCSTRWYKTAENTRVAAHPPRQ